MLFPLDLLHLLRCTRDGAPLVADREHLVRSGSAWGIARGHVTCSACATRYAIEGGILDLIAGRMPEGPSAHEQAVRDAQASALDPATRWFDSDHHRMEIVPTLAAIAPDESTVMLELGCGDGRYTTHLAPRCRAIVAADFSRESLRVLAGRLDGAGHVALVLADVTTLRIQSGAFDRVFSTLTSNLPSAEQRQALYRLAAGALRRGGRFVHSTHHHGLRARLAGEAKSGPYRAGGIFRHNFTLRECAREMRAHFTDVVSRPIQVYLPFARRLRLPLVLQSRVGERLPGLNRLGELVLCVATHDVTRKRLRHVRRVTGAAIAVGAMAGLVQMDLE